MSRLRLVVRGCCLATGFAALAGAQSPPTLVADPSHTLHDGRGAGAASFRIRSSILNETRRVDVTLPASYSRSAARRKYPVIVVLDGEADLAPAAAVSDELARNGLIPESIIVAVENTNRLRDLTPPGLSVSGSSLREGGDRFLDFLESELLPAVDAQFRGAGPRTLVGHSSGGILATYAAATRPTYRAVVSIDAPINLGENWLAKKLIARASAAPAVLRYVSYEVRYGWPDDQWAALSSGAPPVWKLHRERLALEGHETVFMLAAYLGLREVFKDYSRLAAPQNAATTVLPYYDTVGAAFGATLIAPSRVLRDAVDDLVMEGRGKAASEAYATLVAGYGAPPDSATLVSEIADAERLPPPAETVDALLHTPFPTLEEARPYVGDWIGDSWLNADEPRTGKTTLRIRIDSGRVIGELIRSAAPPAVRVKRLDYLRVTPQGLTFGVLNGMRPRGVMLYEGVIHGDTLAGSSRFGGISLRDSDGLNTRLGFSFSRRVK